MATLEPDDKRERKLVSEWYLFLAHTNAIELPLLRKTVADQIHAHEPRDPPDGGSAQIARPDPSCGYRRNRHWMSPAG
jgi:hypothetical protein